MRARVVRSHRPDSWTRAFIGQVVFLASDAPYVELAGVPGHPYKLEPIRGWDVDMDQLTFDQRKLLWDLTQGQVIGDLFLPVECAELLDT